MKTIQDMIPMVRDHLRTDVVRQGLGLCALAVMTAISAAMVKEASVTHHMPALASVARVEHTANSPEIINTTHVNTPQIARAVPTPATSKAAGPHTTIVEPTAEESAKADDMIASLGTQIRWFNGRPIRPARVVWMQVTAYSPDARSCGSFADGKTATLHSVQTNGGHLVAADTRLFPFGSLLSIEGYANNQVVPVLDRGGAIKGNHIDLLMPTHRKARHWGNRRMPVIVWEYADGKPMDDPRAFR